MNVKAAYNAALSSLSVTQYQSAVVSNNIANANVQGYSAQQVNMGTTYTDGYGTGVQVTSVSNYYDENLYSSYVDANSQTQEAKVQASYMSNLLDSFGTVDDDNSLPDLIADMDEALSDLALTPESQAAKSTFINEADAMADQLNYLSAEVQNQREQTDQAIEGQINEINNALETIDDLNQQIMVKTKLGENTSALEDQRRQALDVVAESMDVTFFTNGNNEMHVYTSSGQPLVDSRAHELSYEATNNVNASTTFENITLDGRNINNSISGGELGGLMTLRDETLVARQQELNELAGVLAETLNSVLNTGTPFPGQNSITGQESFANADAFSGSGTFRIVVNDEDGVATSVNDLDLSTYATVGDLVADINAIDGVSASLDANGKLSISADDGDSYIALSEMDSTVGADNKGVSDYFGMNDLFTGSDASSISVRSDLKENPSTLSTGQLSQDSSLSAGDVSHSVGDASVAQAMDAALKGNVDFDSAGNLDGTTTSLFDYSNEILSNFAVETKAAQSEFESKSLISELIANDITNQSGVNIDEETAKLSILQTQYAASSQVLSTLDEMFQSLLNAVS